MNNPRLDLRTDVANIGKAVIIKGELSGSEDLYLDGEVEGTIELHQNCLTVGPNGRIRAHINAREVVIHGKVDGNIHATDRVELRRTAVHVGDIATQRISIEDGAFYKGTVDVQRDVKAQVKPSPAVSAAAGAVANATNLQPSLAEKK